MNFCYLIISIGMNCFETSSLLNDSFTRNQSNKLFKMESNDEKCLTEWSINIKRRSTILRHYNRKNYETREKSNFKDVCNYIFSEPTTGKNDFIF